MYATTSTDKSSLDFICENLNVTTFVDFLVGDDKLFKQISLIVLSNISCSSSDTVTDIIKTGCLSLVKSTISSRSDLTCYACSLVSNIAADSVESIDALLDYKIFEEVTNIIFSSLDLPVLFIKSVD